MRAMTALLWAFLSLLATNVMSSEATPQADNAITAETVVAADEPALAVDIWPMVGQAKLKVLVWEVYDSALFTPSGTWQGEAPYQLSLIYLRNIPASKLVEETEKAWQKQGRNHPKLNEWLALLGELWPDITKGDNLVFGLNASGDSVFWFNGSPIGGIDDRDFGPLFGGIWLAPDTPRPELRAQLIGSTSKSAQNSRPD
ncbi:MAG: chalcone isomerase family protein [Proteobacteria bacterium]|nr:chalcone isomerase family protein [Pseudomonadota bacterium]